jgi:hypothetical protein
VAVGAEGGDLGVRGGGRGAEGDGRGDLGDGVVHPFSFALLSRYCILCYVHVTTLSQRGFLFSLDFSLEFFFSSHLLLFGLPFVFVFSFFFRDVAECAFAIPGLLGKAKKERDSGRKRYLYHTSGKEEQQQRRCRNSDEAKKK